MSLFDWVESGLAHHDVELPWFKGSYSSTMGDMLAACFGARHTHIFGSEIKLVCDPEDMLLGKLGEALPLFTALLAGVGGQTTFVYGTNTMATYEGPRVNIQRAENAGKTSENRLFRLSTEVDPIDMATIQAVRALSLLICATALALELALHFHYPKFGSKEGEEMYGKVPEILKTCVMAITDRLMGLLKELECAGSWANFSEMFAKEGAYSLFLANVIATVFCPPCAIGLMYTGTAAYYAKQVQANAVRVAEAT